MAPHANLVPLERLNPWTIPVKCAPIMNGVVEKPMAVAQSVTLATLASPTVLAARHVLVVLIVRLGVPLVRCVVMAPGVIPVPDSVNLVRQIMSMFQLATLVTRVRQDPFDQRINCSAKNAVLQPGVNKVVVVNHALLVQFISTIALHASIAQLGNIRCNSKSVFPVLVIDTVKVASRNVRIVRLGL